MRFKGAILSLVKRLFQQMLPVSLLEFGNVDNDSSLVFVVASVLKVFEYIILFDPWKNFTKQKIVSSS